MSAIRTSTALVQGVMAPGGDYDLVNTPDLTPAMTAANLLVNRVVTLAAGKGWPITDSGAYPAGVGSEAEVLERWLSAHFYQMSDKGYTSRSTQGASGSFQGQATMGIEATFYGQSAMAMDTSRVLAAINKGGIIQAFRVGTPGNGYGRGPGCW